MVLVFDNELFTKLRALRDYAEAHPLPMDYQLDVKNKEELAPGDHNEYRLVIQNMKIVFSLDEHPMGHIRHLSVSVAQPGKLPPINVVSLLMSQLNFRDPIEGCKVWLEYIKHDHQAVNVAELIPTPTP